MQCVCSPIEGRVTYPGAIRAPQVVEFPQHLARHVPGKRLIIWHGLAADRSRLVRAYADAQDGRITLERHPAHTPELNPTEYIWGHLKAPRTAEPLSEELRGDSVPTRRALRRMRLRQPLVDAFWYQSGLFG